MESDLHSNPDFRHILCALLCDLRSERDVVKEIKRMKTLRVPMSACLQVRACTCVPARACVFYQQTAEEQESSLRTQINHFVERH